MVASWEIPLSDDQRAAYLQDAEEFLSSPKTTLVTVGDGRNFHRGPMTLQKPTSTVLDDLPERLAIARRVQAKIREAAPSVSAAVRKELKLLQNIESFRFNLMQFSAFLYTDIEQLRFALHGSGGDNLTSITGIESFLAICKALMHLAII